MLISIYMQILDMTKIASIVIVVILLARLLLKRLPKVVSYALWAVVLFRLLCPLSIEVPVSIMPELTPTEATYTLADVPITPAGAVEAAYEAMGDALNGGLGIQHIRTELPAEDGANVSVVTSTWWEVWILFGQYVWLAGILGMAIYAVASYARLRRKLITASPLRDNIWCVDEITSPFVLGLVRPKIYLPSSMSEQELSYIILHEQHHIRRFDHVIKALAFVALCIHWFNPLVWVAFIMAGKDMEMSCDEAVVKKMGEGVLADYTASLLSLATGRHIIAGMPLAFGEGDTKGRIRNLANWKKPAFGVLLAAVIACVALAVGLLTNPAGISITRLVIDEVDMSAALSDIGSITVRHDGDAVTCDRGTANRFISTIGKIKIQKKPVSESRSEDRDKSFTITINDSLQMHFSDDFYEIWFDNGVKPSFSYRIINPESAEELLMDFRFSQSNGGTQELIPGTTYVSYRCIYMNPLSSYAAIGGDSGCVYTVGEDYLETVDRNNGGAQNLIEVQSWEWQPLPYTDEEWAALYIPAMNAITNLSEVFDEIGYLPLTAGKFLMRVDGDIWLVELGSNPQMGTYLWSIYSLIPEGAMGVAQWEFAPYFSSRSPVFQFRFDMEHTEISAICEAGQLVEFNFGNKESGPVLMFPAGEPLSWSPSNEEYMMADTSIIRFTIHDGDSTPYHGTIYIETSGNTDNGRIYTASLIGTGLRLSPNLEGEGGIISLQS